jgi:hypothetical protein
MPNCFDPISNQRLATYESESEAISEIEKTWNRRLRAYGRFRCTACRLWHVLDEEDLASAAPAPSEDPAKCPHCTSKLGLPKLSYPSSVVARDAMSKLTTDRGIGSRVYPCPVGFGWHVTTSFERRSRW